MPNLKDFTQGSDTREQGFTLPELMVAIALGALISILMMSIFVQGYGGLVREQTRANMVLESQLFLRRITEDIRIAGSIEQNNILPDTYAPGGGWTTSDPANILIMSQPATDSDYNFINDPDTLYPYNNEVIYFGDGRNMYRRTLANTTAIDNSATTTCPSDTSGCPPDILLSENLKNMTFVFYDINDAVTTTLSDARSVQLTVNLERNIFGTTISINNTSRMTLRNDN